MAISGFIDPEKFPHWKKPQLQDLSTRKDLNGKKFTDLESGTEFELEHRQLTNSDIRCTIITGYKHDQVLYDIFYRLNSGSVPLSSQELRQVLNRGDFSNFIMDQTNNKIPLHDVMNLSGPDARLRDSEILLRYISISLYGENYAGNLSKFLDESLAFGNDNWITG